MWGWSGEEVQEEGDIYIHTADLLGCATGTNTTLYSNYTPMGLLRWHQRTGPHVPMQETKETQVWSLDWEDPLEKETVTGSSILIWKNAMGRRAWWGRAYGVAKSWTQLNMHPNTHIQLKKKKPVPQMKMCSCKTYPTFIATTFKTSQTRNNLEPITWKNDLKCGTITK